MADYETRLTSHHIMGPRAKRPSIGDRESAFIGGLACHDGAMIALIDLQQLLPAQDFEPEVSAAA